MPLLRPILKQALLHPRRTAIIDDRGETTSLKLLGGVFHMARLIRQSTNKPNVAIMLPTSGAFPVALLGCWQAGRVAVPINYLLAPDDLKFVLEDAQVDVVLTVGKLLEHIGGEEAIPDRVKIIKLDEQKFTGIPPMRCPAKPSDEDLALLLYTSGTSGRPKGVMLSHGNLSADVFAAKEHARLDKANTFLGVLPQFHAFGVTVLTLLPLVMGARVVYTARFVPRKLVELIKKHRPDVFIAVPSMYGALLSVKKATADDYKSLSFAISGAEPLPQSVYDAFKERYNIELMEGYGLTETSPASNMSVPWCNKNHSVGKALPGVSILIVDEKDNLLDAETEGEILIAGPIIMQGYWNLPEKTAEVMVDIKTKEGKTVNAFRTGDIGKLDDEGCLYITGRKKEMLIIGGENVFPREIEEVLTTHPDVRAAAVIGKQDDMRGETPIAFVELEDDATFDEQALRAHCRDGLPQYKVPREIRHLDELPRNPTGKILRRELKA